MLSDPAKFVRTKINRDRVIPPLARIVSDVAIDVSAEVDPLGDDFDYRDKLRDREWVIKFAASITATHRKLVVRGTIPSFEQDWADGNTKKG